MARFGLRFPSLVAALLALCVLGPANGDAVSSSLATPTVTTAPIFLPYYPKAQWSVVRGSILSSNNTASETTYTIFCPTQPAACDLSLESPFVIVEGPGTLKFHGTFTSTYVADLECKLNGTTAATCSGFTDGQNTGLTEVSWTSTLSGSDVEWGTLTLADKPTTTDNSLDVTATDIPAPTVPSSILYYPTETGKGTGASIRVDIQLAFMATVASLLAAGFIL
ncbi:hypothetical protein TOPH_02284 [Tolypocladium ophioglossoides CBS 100239]|uniref:Uncharacterized protein n=1 Tax=Tolypocladium ophioglossoides (strain CBS 100239) TaxID=1163406 RepID=A0A0L0NGD3_TOLOC|nr:hypothetical protein TOPH_02284 [Tolypocladium ophioglossoides CBS 100239]